MLGVATKPKVTEVRIQILIGVKPTFETIVGLSCYKQVPAFAVQLVVNTIVTRVGDLIKIIQTVNKKQRFLCVEEVTTQANAAKREKC